MSNTSLNFLKTSLGKKVMMGVTGLFLISFLVVHAGINALIFFNDGGELFNAGSEFMAHNVFIRAMEIVLFIGIIWHIIQSLILTIDNAKARPVKYAINNGNANSKWYSRWMGLLGTLILIFLIIHLRHFWVVSRFTDEITSGKETLYNEMKEVFSIGWIVALYALAQISLGYHLMHGFQSSFQTLGFNHPKYTPLIKTIGFWFSIIISLIFAAMPLSMYFGWIK
ncbi:MAG: succinate dehydrogenase cytochrome b subunit [Bacteroidetes bacterium]|nr:succinate dehydrogenase cytochrome b subunit [Bacteroidota bacterium]